jgi:[acyl-carrier-protein] S-malonyltransferase
VGNELQNVALGPKWTPTVFDAKLGPKHMSIAFVFPGQGSQSVGMGIDLYERFAAMIEPFYQRAEKALDFDLKKVIFEGPEETLTLTQNAQPAILLDSAIKYELLKDRLKPHVAAGHSLGEYSALVCAGVLSLEDGLQLVHKRGKYMQEAVPVGRGAMVAILKLEAEKVEEICKQSGAEIANFNAPGQIVISGERDKVWQAKVLAEEAGGRGIELEVSAPFHSSLMAPAEERLKPDIERVVFQKPAFPVISTISGQPETDPARLKTLLMKQITSQVRWVNYVQTMRSLGVKRLIEVGPGEVLTRLNRRIDSELKALSFREVF